MTANEKPRIGTTRTASEPRGSSGRDSGRRGVSGSSSRTDPTAVGREMGHRRGASDTTGVYPGAAYGYGGGGEGYGGYAPVRSVVAPAPGSRRGTGRPQERYIDEEEEYASDAYEEDGAVPDGDFEMMGSRRPSTSSSSPVKGPRRGVARRPEVHKYRVKVHSQEDTRYIIIGPTVGFREFEMRIREKFGFVSLLKIKMQDEGDMITMVDQEDLDLLIGASREMARCEGSEMGKMEVCSFSCSSFCVLRYAN